MGEKETINLKNPRLFYGDNRPVFPIGLGGMRLSIAGRPDEQKAFEVIRAYVDAGGEIIDTADVYCLDDSERGHNERIIAKALEQLSQTNDVMVATKGGMYRPQGKWCIDARPETLRQSCETSLKHLGRHQIELYQLHTVDPNVPFEDSVGELSKLQAEGKIVHIGLSNVNVDQLKQATAIVPIATVQNQLNLQKQDDVHNGLLAYCRDNAINYLPYRPLGARVIQHHLLESNALQNLAKQYQCHPQQLMLAWLMNLGPQVLPIPGTSNPEHLKIFLDTLNLGFDVQDLNSLGSYFETS